MMMTNSEDKTHFTKSKTLHDFRDNKMRKKMYLRINKMRSDIFFMCEKENPFFSMKRIYILILSFQWKKKYFEVNYFL